MSSKTVSIWLVVAVALGLFAYSLVSILANGFQLYKLYPLALGIVNLVAVYLMRE